MDATWICCYNGAALFGRHLGSSAQIGLLSTFLHIFTFFFLYA